MLGVRIFDNTIKPDLVAPGNKLIAAAAPNNKLYLDTPTLSNADLLTTTSSESMMYMSGTSMSAPVVAGAAALLLQANPKLTPSMVKMILQYSAQPIAGANMFEQGAGQLNLEGAIRLANYIRNDVTFNGMARNTAINRTGVTMPTASTSLNGNTFGWSQMITTQHGFITGNSLISKYQKVYDHNSWFQKGISSSLLGGLSINTNIYTTGLTLKTNVMTSDGTPLGNGIIFLASGVSDRRRRSDRRRCSDRRRRFGRRRRFSRRRRSGR